MNKCFAGLVTKTQVEIPLIGVKVISDIVGMGAKTKIVQEYKNSESSPVEVVYKFPLPENAALCAFSATMGGRVVLGKIDERNKAFERYDDALIAGHGAILLDEERPNIFTLSLGNLNPGMSAVIEIEFVSTLEAHGNSVRFLLPTTISPRYIPENMQESDGVPEDLLVNPPSSLAVPYQMQLNVNIYAKETISLVESPSHRISAAMQDDSISVSLSGTDVLMNKDFVLDIEHKKEFGSRGYRFDTDNERFCQIELTAKSSDEVLLSSQTTVQEVIFLLDCSYSMQGSSIEEARRAIGIFLKGLSAGTLFNIYCFGSEFHCLFEKSLPCDEHSMIKANDFIARIDAELGGTEVLAPIKDSYSKQCDPENEKSIILITDGEVGNEQEVLDLVNSGPKQTRIFSVGIGYGPNEYFIRQIARSTNGASELIAAEERIEPKVLRLFRKVMSQPLKNLQVNWESEVEQSPREPIAYIGDTVSIIGKMKHTAKVSDTLTITGTLNGQKMKWVVPVEVVKAYQSAIPQLWARAAISDLEHSARTSKGSKQQERHEKAIKKEIVAISKKYSVVSKHSSFVGIETRSDVELTKGESMLRRVPVMLTKDWGGSEKRGPHLLFTLPHRRCANIPPVFSIKEEKNSIEDVCQPSDIVLYILERQRFEGGFLIDEGLAKVLGLDLTELRNLASMLTLSFYADKFAMLSTVLLLTILKKTYFDRESEWSGIVSKSTMWLANNIKRTEATIQGETLDSWAEDYVDQLPAIGNRKESK